MGNAAAEGRERQACYVATSLSKKLRMSVSPDWGPEHGFQHRYADENSLSCGGVEVSYLLRRAVLKTGISARADRERVEKNRENDENDLLQKDENLRSQTRRGSF